MHSLSKHSDRPDLRSLRGARVVVTGATGFIGRHLCPELQAHGATLVLFSRDRHAAHRELFPNARTVRVDLLDREAITSALGNVKPDVVFHLAGFVSGDRNVKAMARAFDGNVLPTASLLLGCAEKTPDTRVITTTSLDTSNPAREAARTGRVRRQQAHGGATLGRPVTHARSAVRQRTRRHGLRPQRSQPAPPGAGRHRMPAARGIPPSRQRTPTLRLGLRG